MWWRKMKKFNTYSYEFDIKNLAISVYFCIFQYKVNPSNNWFVVLVFKSVICDLFFLFLWIGFGIQIVQKWDLECFLNCYNLSTVLLLLPCVEMIAFTRNHYRYKEELRKQVLDSRLKAMLHICTITSIHGVGTGSKYISTGSTLKETWHLYRV